MKRILDGLDYPVIVTDDAPGVVAGILHRRGSKAVLISDRNVAERGEAVAEALRAAGSEVLSVFTIVAGERHKRPKTVAELQSALIAAGVERTTHVIAVGGGTLTDTAGFAAATLLRGLPWMAVPTTVLGMVDAAIGGKTGVNLPQGKNLAGAIWPPAAVIADISALATLGLRERKTGLAEVVKAAIIGDPQLLDLIDTFDVAEPPHAWLPIIARAASVKIAIVARDPHERGERQTLNLGHTFAHALEQASNYRLTHGAAVALGLRAAGILGRDRTAWPHAEHSRMLHALRRCGFPLHNRHYAPDDVVQAMRVDKKRENGEVRFVLPARLGDVRYGYPIPEAAVRSALAELGAPVGSGW